MEKDQILLWGLGIFLFWNISLSAETRISTIGKNGYVPFEEIRKHIPGLQPKFESATLVGSISHATGEIRFRIGASFYAINGSLEKTNLPVIYRDKDFLLPPDMVEAIFVRLLPGDVSYEFKDGELVFDLLPKAERLRLSAIIVDAGHGGKDPGTSSPKGIQEKMVSLQVAKFLKKFLNKVYPEVRVILTRAGDSFIELERRSEIANSELQKGGSVLFVSLHCNASISDDVNGYEVYYLSQTPSTEAAREISLFENKISGKKGGVPYRKIQAGMMSSLIQRRSRLLARSVESEMKKNLGPKILSRGVKKADFSVLRGSLMPAILVEMGYLTHSKESDLLADKTQQVKLAKSILEGVRAYELAKD
ncbi:N-acetylmuramoyl-L-alanine amidase [Leptospira langatensis]|uniref:N-acetylmuramoyl-L-alanine amidase n=1 Tax=Leptospira langatensis TaxID=2484983 RepID=A0A5F1ZR44_9LEPT|nr:N-acetylmuramoyl-L-alanine amidase [Leptospira langatensis]TGK02633.1 N-acetylmuramoyl-L-alanine amidase [Leptospira langatensis]TGL40165.1 N-acetylmuramoyl-L-alanine amidase [Leptospira langatensis]